MSSISLVLTGTQPCIGVCPDPHLPPKLLASVVKDVRLHTEVSVTCCDGTKTVAMSVEHLLDLLSETAQRESAAPVKAVAGKTHTFNAGANAPRSSVTFDSDAIIRAFAACLNRLVKTLNESVQVVTVVMGEVNHVVLVLPPSMSATARDKLAHIGELLTGVTVSTVPYHASVMLHYGDGKIPTTPLIDLQWDTGLRVGCRSFLNGDAADMVRPGRDNILCSSSFSLDTWHMLTGRWLTENVKAMIPDHASWSNADARAFRDWVVATSPGLCEAVLKEDSSFSLAFRDWKHALDKNRMAELRAMLFLTPTKFLRASLCDKGIANPNTVVVSHGSTLRWPAAQRCLRQLLAELGRSDESSDSDASAALGAFQLIKPPTCVPYDCGVLIRPVGQREGTGTLVMVRGAPADAKAASRTFCLPKSRSEDVEVLFYTRCVDFDARRVTYRFAEKSIRFAPAHDKAGKTSFYATMTLRTDKEGRVNAVRTVMHDKISGKSYEFPALAFTGGLADAAVISRSKEHTEARQWCELIDGVSHPDAGWTVQDWRKVLDPVLPLLSRDEYLAIIFGIETLFDDLGRFTRLRNALPEQVQEQVRIHVHGQMTQLAKRIGRRHVSEWAKLNPHPEKNETLARDFKNSVYQDAVEDEQLLNEASNLARSYETGCSDPSSLRVDWNKKDFPL